MSTQTKELDFSAWMRGLCAAPWDQAFCQECGGVGLAPVHCCPGEQCGCMGLPVNFEPCGKCEAKQPNDKLVESWGNIKQLQLKLERARHLYVQLTNCDYVSDNGQIAGVCATPEIMQGFDELFETGQMGHGVCERRCTGCEGMDHHWMEGFTEDDDGNIIDPDSPVWICKHCEITRPYL